MSETATPAVIVQHGTAPDTTPAKRKPMRGVVTVLLWPIRFLLDKNGNPSTTKVLIFCILGAALNHTPLDAVTAVALVSASFGYSAWKDYASRFTATASTAASVAISASHAFSRDEHESHSTVDVTQRILDERGPTGEPPRSLPAVGATTPAGDN